MMNGKVCMLLGTCMVVGGSFYELGLEITGILIGFLWFFYGMVETVKGR